MCKYCVSCPRHGKGSHCSNTFPTNHNTLFRVNGVDSANQIFPFRVNGISNIAHMHYVTYLSSVFDVDQQRQPLPYGSAAIAQDEKFVEKRFLKKHLSD